MVEVIIIGKREKGFTLLELLVSMAVYSILLIIIFSAIITFSKINKTLLTKDKYDEAAIMENFIVDLWKKNNGDIILNQDSLMEIDDNKLVFAEGTLSYADKPIFISKAITAIKRTVYENHVEFIIISDNNLIKTIILYNSGGNAHES